jgi:hypothetical protein
VRRGHRLGSHAGLTARRRECPHAGAGEGSVLPAGQPAVARHKPRDYAGEGLRLDAGCGLPLLCVADRCAGWDGRRVAGGLCNGGKKMGTQKNREGSELTENEELAGDAGLNGVGEEARGRRAWPARGCGRRQ